MKSLLSILLLFTVSVKAQPDSIFVHLYTDSLKKGTFNYINIDGIENGNYFPLDTSVIALDCSYGEFFGNNLWIPEKPVVEKVTIKAWVKKKPELHREFIVFIKRSEDPPLKTEEEILHEIKMKTKTKTKSKS